MARLDDDDQGPQLVHLATLGVTALPDRLDGVALILRMPSGSAGEQAAMADWIRLCSKEDCALITAMVFHSFAGRGLAEGYSVGVLCRGSQTAAAALW